MRGGTNKGALAALGIAGLIWAYKNRDKISAKIGELRNQLPSDLTKGQFRDRPFDAQTDPPSHTRLGDNYNTNI